MAKFARIIELENDDQVLITIEYEEETDTYQAKIRCEFDGLTACAKLGFDEENKAITAMNEYPKESAVKFRVEMEKMLQ